MPAGKPAHEVAVPHGPAGGTVVVSARQVDAQVARSAFASDRDMADYLRVDEAQPRRWRDGTAPVGPARTLTDVAYVWRRLTADQAPGVAYDWLRFDGNARLGMSPLEALRRGRIVEVVAAWDANASGGYA